jgi:hypothetical protein
MKTTDQPINLPVPRNSRLATAPQVICSFFLLTFFFLLSAALHAAQPKEALLIANGKYSPFAGMAHPGTLVLCGKFQSIAQFTAIGANCLSILRIRRA